MPRSEQIFKKKITPFLKIEAAMSFQPVLSHLPAPGVLSTSGGSICSSPQISQPCLPRGTQEKGAGKFWRERISKSTL